MSVNRPTCWSREAPVSFGKISSMMRSTNIQSNSRLGSTTVVDFNIDILEAQFRDSFSPTLRRVKPAPTLSYCASRAGGAMPARRADADDATVGHNIRVQRLAKKMSQSALA